MEMTNLSQFPDRISNAETSRAGCRTVELLIAPGVSLVTLGSVLEPLRMANRIAERYLYDVRIVTESNAPVEDANRIAIAPTHVTGLETASPDLALLCVDVDIHPRVGERCAPGCRGWPGTAPASAPSAPAPSPWPASACSTAIAAPCTGS